MLLRGSGEHTGENYDLTAIVAGREADGEADEESDGESDGASGGGVAAAGALTAYADAFFDDGQDFVAARERLHAEIGDEALVDAAGVLAIFNAVVRIADATGIPLEDQKAGMSADFRDALGINDYPAAAGKV